MEKKSFFEKYQLEIIVFALFVGLYIFRPNSVEPKIKEITIHDTIYDTKMVDSLQLYIQDLTTELAQKNSYISEREQQALVRIEQIKYYISICEKRPQNKTFFFGWVKRAVK
jgi:hypothetical protein